MNLDNENMNVTFVDEKDVKFHSMQLPDYEVYRLAEGCINKDEYSINYINSMAYYKLLGALFIPGGKEAYIKMQLIRTEWDE